MVRGQSLGGPQGSEPRAFPSYTQNLGPDKTPPIKSQSWMGVERFSQAVFLTWGDTGCCPCFHEKGSVVWLSQCGIFASPFLCIYSYLPVINIHTHTHPAPSEGASMDLSPIPQAQLVSGRTLRLDQPAAPTGHWGWDAEAGKKQILEVQGRAIDRLKVQL